MKIFHHNDMDGYGAASLVVFEYMKDKTILEDYKKIIEESCIELTHDHEKDKEKFNTIEDGELVFIVDYSFGINTKEWLDNILKKTEKIVWIDHHKTSLELVEKYPEYKDIKGLLFNGISGTALTYIYFTHCKFNECPLYIKLISDYDCWTNEMQPSTDYFKLGYDAQSDKFEFLFKLYQEYKFKEYGDIYSSAIEAGKIIKSYIDSDNEYYRKQYGYESETEDGVKIFCVNKDTNSWIFGDLIKKYPAVCNYAFNGKKYVYSFYSDQYSDFDCAEYCTRHGGGGHKGAAGFMCSELLYKAR